ncbi:transcription antitermination factor NusB [Propioniciclava coleopterorum]|uniref:Transcription antitermination protein NusB n=1 Tax=Propioniciclava coleopterorum TaxID=2714937 RepID=A0A6G7YA47_9ACTN|nr:transcription antitermination factor NusB [Propioniciclava coleopterorum]QIK73556.1 transcription antitermination factor NusB [Propioniciclava coleopterorum]
MTEPATPSHGRVRNRENSTRTKARKRALDILFESDLRERPTTETLADRVGWAEPPVRPFTIDLVNGYLAHAEEIDALLAASLTPGWTLERMNRVDRNLARIALFELAHTDTPPQVAIKEAVDLAAELSTDESPAFVNAVLAQAAARLRRSVPASGADQAPETGADDAAADAGHTQDTPSADSGTDATDTAEDPTGDAAQE